MPKVDVARDEHQEPHAYDQDEERAKSASAAAGVGHGTLPAEENECDNAEDEEQELEDHERREDPAPERHGQPTARTATGTERLAVSRDCDDREQHGDHESEREEAATDHAWLDARRPERSVRD